MLRKVKVVCWSHNYTMAITAVVTIYSRLYEEVKKSNIVLLVVKLCQTLCERGNFTLPQECPYVWVPGL